VEADARIRCSFTVDPSAGWTAMERLPESVAAETEFDASLY
jgi:hypothetical protein